MACSCPLESVAASTAKISCQDCLAYSSVSTKGDHCCVFCSENADNSFSMCQAQSSITQASCPVSLLVCKSNASSFSPTDVVLSVLGLLALVVLIMTRTLWIPKVKVCLARFGHKAAECSVTKSGSGKAEKKTSSTGSSSLEDLLAFHHRATTESSDFDPDDDHGRGGGGGGEWRGHGGPSGRSGPGPAAVATLTMSNLNRHNGLSSRFISLDVDDAYNEGEGEGDIDGEGEGEGEGEGDGRRAGGASRVKIGGVVFANAVLVESDESAFPLREAGSSVPVATAAV